MTFEFEWGISEPDAAGLVMVRERLVGTEHINTYGPMPKYAASGFVKARRAFVNRITTKAGALQVFAPRIRKQ